MKTIVIPTDFSPTALSAIHYGVEMAQFIGARVILFHAYQMPINYNAPDMVFVTIEDLYKLATSRITTLKSELEKIAPNVSFHTETILGDTIDELNTLCNNLNPFALVMGYRGNSNNDNGIFGSTTLSAINHITYPILCIPTGATFSHGRQPLKDGIKKIAFACDFNHVVETKSIIYILGYVKAFFAHLDVVHIYTHHGTHQEFKKEFEQLRSILHEVNPVFHAIEKDDIQKGINDFCSEHNIDILITIPKKHSALQRMFTISETKEILTHTHIPVLCIHE